MLSEFTPVPTLAVRDLEKARTFYEDVLGLTQVGDAPDGVMYRAGSSQILVYPSAYAGTNKATAVSFDVPGGQFDTEVEALRARGVEFQTFDLPGASWVDGVATSDGMKAVWFADPDGNILNLETSLEATSV
ncbi:glyoxalase (plasmid) [Cellulomonas sp. WB94]|uniref:VOC family protein n=1 Tax=Cellulomonas sp. WB94 TaxID=2173174 RepID=UPI000D587C6B|nr:VOC family protein [Cellulomonas sp. WB94]PVU84292.1 glyoxalase [Cellulomonas sp. WB94]